LGIGEREKRDWPVPKMRHQEKTDLLCHAFLPNHQRRELSNAATIGKPVCVDELGPGARGAIPKIRFFAALSLLLAVLQVTGSSGLAKVGRGTGALAPVSRSIPILPRLQKEQT
jgi:hypothetical protein